MEWDNNSEVLIYQTEDGQTKIDVKIEDDTVWLSLNQMAELFQRDKSVISRHIKNIFSEGELDKDSVVAFFATTATDNKTYDVAYYNLVKNDLSQVERHFLDNIESTLKKLKDKK